MKACLLSASLAALAVGHASTATASGGLFVQPGGVATVAEHRTLISISPQSTTIIDQMVVTGTPESFAWLLPIKGQVYVGLSSDALFKNLDAATAPVVLPPPVMCAPGCAGSGGSGGGGSGGSGGGTAIIAEQTIGPYETVQLSSADPTAVDFWMASHGYDIPPSIQPVIDAFISEGYSFLAMKFVPSSGVGLMQPVRVTMPGAVPTLPLRIAAAGMAPTMPARLFIVSQGREEPKNFPSATVDPGDLVWSWDTGNSNYDLLRQNAINALGGAGWLVEQSDPFAATEFQSLLLGLATSQPASSGYGDFGVGSVAECQADLDAIFGSLNPANTWVTRLYADLSGPALENDLDLGAANDPNPVPREMVVDPNSTVGTPPECPCGTGGAGGTGTGGTGGGMAGSGGTDGGMAGSGTGGTGSGTAGSGTGGTGGGTAGSGTGGTGGGTAGSGAGGSDNLCIPGEQVECACPGSAQGAQACLPDGRGFGECQCADPATPDNDGGCGCRAAGARTSSTGYALGLIALAAAALRRRRTAAFRRSG